MNESKRDRTTAIQIKQKKQHGKNITNKDTNKERTHGQTTDGRNH